MPDDYDIPTGDEYTPEDQGLDQMASTPEIAEQETAAQSPEGVMKEELDNRLRQARQEIFKKAVTEPAKKALAEGAKQVTMAVGRALAQAAAWVGGALAASFPVWGPVVGIILAVVVVFAALLYANDQTCNQLSGDDLKIVQEAQGKANLAKCGGAPDPMIDKRIPGTRTHLFFMGGVAPMFFSYTTGQ